MAMMGLEDVGLWICGGAVFVHEGRVGKCGAGELVSCTCTCMLGCDMG